MDKLPNTQPHLPPLPVPDLLRDTLPRWERSLVPFVSMDGSVDGKDALELRRLVADFGRTLGPVLQERLLEHARACQSGNWLDTWWIQLAYHTWREPLPVNSNWFTVFADHPQHPRHLLHPHLAPVPRGHFTAFQVLRCAGFITNALDMKEEIEGGRVQVERVAGGKIELCMHQYKMMFGWTRVPRVPCDEIVCPGGFPSRCRHIVVLVRDQVYQLNVYDKDGGRLTIADLERQLWFIVQHVVNAGELEPPVCVLTADQRDHWAAAREHLLALSPVNKASLDIIESALFVLCLDDRSHPDNYDCTFQNNAHGFNGHNRWFDKAIGIVCNSHGRAGMNGEHSPCDALIPSRLMDRLVSCEPAQNPPNARDHVDLLIEDRPRRLHWCTDTRIQDAIRHAEETARGICRDSDLSVLIYEGYGSDTIRALTGGKMSADAYVQMAMQLAFFRMHGEWCGTYETGSTRAFRLGRTECIRTCSVDSVRFVQQFCDPNVSASEKVAALKKACDAHTEYTIAAMKGKGVDRHILGLKMCMKPGESHPIFSHPAVAKSTYFRLSTSSLSTGELYNGTGFGCVAPDGYGINYCIGPKVIKMGVESKKSCRETSTRLFKAELCKAFDDMKAVLEQVAAAAANPASSGKSAKL